MKLNFTETAKNKTTDLNLALFKNGIADWVLLVLCILLGAGIGFGVSFFTTPLYEATALVSTNLQLHKDGAVTEFMLDSQVNHIGDLYFNPKVVDRLIQSEAEKGFVLSLESLKSKATVERRMLNSLIKIRDENPENAARLASTWAESLYQTLQEAYPIAVEHSTAKNTLTLLENCAKKEEGKALDAFCESMTKPEYDQALTEAKQVLENDEDKTLGLSAYLNVSQFQPAEVPTKPISYHRGSMVLAGGFIGLITALAYFIIRTKHD